MNNEINIADLINSNKKFKDNEFKNKLNLAILRNITVDPIVECLINDFAREDIGLKTYMGDFDKIFPEFLDSESNLFKFNPDVIAIHLNLSLISPKLIYEFSSLNKKGIEKCKDDVLSYFNKILDSAKFFPSTIFILHKFEIPIYPTFGIIDSKMSSMQGETIASLNKDITQLFSKNNNFQFVDNNRILSKLGEDRYYDYRYWSIGKAPYKINALSSFSKDYLRICRAKLGKNSKCLVLDCDNTLWKGIIGEDGISGIGLGSTYPGNNFVEFQKAILDLGNRGVILAIASKNNHEDVIDVLNNHPNMILREDKFAVIKANWNDKPTNIKEIASDLNIGLDSLVFIDDNKFETEMVKEFLPQVRTIHLPDDPSVYRNLILSCGFFDSLTYSNEDKNRGKMYKAESKRKVLKSSIDSIENYFESLEMKLTINKVDSFSIPRISQLTQRTNQFNLTTKRYSENDILGFSTNKNSDVLYAELEDKFGNMGIIGASIIVYNNLEATLDTFLLSCRVIGRGVEDRLLLETIKLAERNKAVKILSKYEKSKKNNQVADFYDKRNFNIISSSQESKHYSFDIGNSFDTPSYFKEVNILHDN